MCGRYLFLDNQHPKYEMIMNHLLQHLTKEQLDKISLHLVFPKDTTVVYTFDKNVFIPKVMQFGYSLQDKIVFNARYETVEAKNLFRNDYSYRRCIVIASGYYEYDDHKNAYQFSNEGKFLYLAGIYNDINEFCILTQPSNEETGKIHHRTPLILDRNQAIAFCKFQKFSSTIPSMKIKSITGKLSEFNY